MQPNTIAKKSKSELLLNNMTFDEIKRIPDLQIEVTPAVEDAFYFLRGLEADFPESPDNETPEEYDERLSKFFDPSINAGKRLGELEETEKWQAVNSAYQMIDNLKKYGVACAEWV